MIELEGEQYLDGDEASAMLGVKLATLYAYVSRGILHSYKQGIKRQRLYKQSEIEALLRLRPGDAPSPTISSKTAKDDKDEQAGAKREPPTLPRAEDWVPYT
jgi:predicted site-specific integrase-resolvase